MSENLKKHEIGENAEEANTSQQLRGMAEHLEDSSQQETIELEREKNAGKILEGFLLLKPEERVLFLKDEDPKNTDKELIRIIQEQLKSRGIEFSELLADKKTKQKDLLSAARKSDLVWGSWSWEDTARDVDFDKFTEFLEEKGKRMAHCPGLTAESLDKGGSLAEDREEMDFRINKMEEKLRDAAGFKITTSYGTNLTIAMRKGERRWIKDNGVITPGKWDNLPGGEVFTTPDEEKVDGILMLSVLQDDVSLEQGVDEFVRLTIVKGKIRKIDGGKSADKLRRYLNKCAADEKDPESVLQCAEIAFGANSKARTVVSNPEGAWNEAGRATIETEKRLGTMHIAFGSSKHGEEGAEGHTSSDTHLDFVIPRNGLTVEEFSTINDLERGKNGKKLINDGGWNFV